MFISSGGSAAPIFDQEPVGPPLVRVAVRTYVAGVLANTPENMRKWIQDPTGVDEKTAMPKIGVSDRDAQDIVAYLYTLR